MAAADARITTLNELITEIKFIKFFAWEGKWIDRTLAARHKELVCFVLAGFNNTFFSLMWNLVPNFVSVISFITYIKTGHSLTVPVAFTAIALFQMLQHPLNMIPYFVRSSHRSDGSSADHRLLFSMLEFCAGVFQFAA